MKRSVVFLENQRQLNVFMAEFSNKLDDFQLMAITPEVCFFLDQRSLPYNTLEEYIDSILPEDEKKPCYQKTSNILKTLDDYFLYTFSDFKSINFTPFKNNFVEFHSSFTYLTRMVRLLDNFFSVRSDQIAYCYFFPDSPSLSMRLIPLIGKRYNISINKFFGGAEQAPSRKPLRKIVGMLKRSECVRKAYIFKILCDGIFTFRRFKAPRILTLNYTYDIRFVLKEILKRNEQIFIWDPLQIREPFCLPNVFERLQLEQEKKERKPELYAQAWALIAAEKDFLTLFEYRGINFFQLLEQALKDYAVTVIPQTLATYIKAEKMIDKYHLQSLLCSGAYYPHQKAVVTAFKNRGLPVFLYQHGSM